MMQITMRVHSLTLGANDTEAAATLYRFDGVKARKERGWIDRVTVPAGDLRLGEIVTVTIERAEHDG